MHKTCHSPPGMPSKPDSGLVIATHRHVSRAQIGSDGAPREQLHRDGCPACAALCVTPQHRLAESPSRPRAADHVCERLSGKARRPNFPPQRRVRARERTPSREVRPFALLAGVANWFPSQPGPVGRELTHLACRDHAMGLRHSPGQRKEMTRVLQVWMSGECVVPPRSVRTPASAVTR